MVSIPSRVDLPVTCTTSGRRRPHTVAIASASRMLPVNWLPIPSPSSALDDAGDVHKAPVAGRIFVRAEISASFLEP